MYCAVLVTVMVVAVTQASKVVVKWKLVTPEWTVSGSTLLI